MQYGLLVKVIRQWQLISWLGIYFFYNTRDFWKDLKCNTSGTKTVPCVVVGVSGTGNIFRTMATTLYENIYLCPE